MAQGNGKRQLWKSIRRSIGSSKGRFLSIVGLIALGSFALVGLTVAGPDMRAAGRDYFDGLNAADITVISDYGLTERDKGILDATEGARQVEYGYLKDAVIDGTDESVRIQSAPEEVSRYEVTEGRMPEQADEVALGSWFADSYDLGDTVTFDEKPDDAGETVLADDTYTVVGFVSSSEIVSRVSMGESTAGSGRLMGYAVVTLDAFDSDVYMTARLTFEDTLGLDPYSDEYADAVAAHKAALEDALDVRAGERYEEVVAEQQEAVDEGQSEVDAGWQELATSAEEIADGAAQLDAARGQVGASKGQLARESASAQAELDAGARELADGRAGLDAAEGELARKQGEYEALAARRPELEAGLAQVGQAKPLVGAARSYVQGHDVAPGMALAMLEQVEGQFFPGGAPGEDDPTSGLYALLSSYKEQLASMAASGATAREAKPVILSGLDDLDGALASLEDDLDGALARLDAAPDELAAAQGQIDAAGAQLSAGEQALADGRAELAGTVAEARAQIAAAEREIAAKEQELAAAQAEYDAQAPGAEERLAQAEEELDQAREKLSLLKASAYDVSTRREIPGADGYTIYASVADIVDSLAAVFPVFLYLVAALVTLTTMTRFVSEERINSGTLAALGYTDGDIVLKYAVYGFLASTLGSLVGVVAGHTLIPLIVYNAYGASFVLPPIALLFDPGITALAFALGFVAAVVPAVIVAARELRARPSELLLPKAPAAGSKIFLERVKPLWRRLSFTHKVTARNIFRYKSRMLMTIFGVAGAVMILIAGFGTQFSISGIKDEQFGSIIDYDMIVAESDTAVSSDRAELDAALADKGVERTSPVHYESLTTEPPSAKDKAEVTLLVPEEPADLASYIKLRHRESGESVALDADGAVISERLSTLMGVGVGDTMEVTDETGASHEVRVTDVCEMYMGHFLFMGERAYEEAFGAPCSANAHLVTLADGSAGNVNTTAADLMNHAAVKGIVQNTALMAEIDTIVAALDKIMVVLIAVGALLAAVILYNLTNINVSERIRELCTIKVLGFFDNEATLYIYRETIGLTFIGVLVGYVLGALMRNYIITVVPPENVMFDPAFAPYVFAIPFVMVAAVTVLLGFIVRRRLRDVDMLEALKSVE